VSWTQIVPSAGFIQPLSKKRRAEIEAKFPSLSIEAIETEFSSYLILRDSDQPPLEDLRKEVDSLLNAVRTVQKKLEIISPGASDLINLSGAHLGHVRVLETLFPFIVFAEASAAHAQRRTPKGQRLMPRTRLARNLAWIVHDGGLEINAKTKKGTLVPLVEILLEDAGEAPSDARKIVTEAMKNWKRPPPNVGSLP
jgi:hypothetical protein